MCKRAGSLHEAQYTRALDTHLAAERRQEFCPKRRLAVVPRQRRQSGRQGQLPVGAALEKRPKDFSSAIADRIRRAPERVAQGGLGGR